MPEPAPSSVQIFYYPTYIEVGWTNEDTYDNVVIHRKVGDADYASYDTITYPTDYYRDTDMKTNTMVKYKLKAYRSPYVPSDFSSEVGYVDERITDTIGVSSATPSEVLGLTDTITDTISLLTGTGEVVGMRDTITDTIGVSTSEQEAATISSNFGYFIGTMDGYVHTYSSAYKSDNGASILSSWRSKTVDFSELNIKFAMMYKTVYRVSIQYVDLESSTPVIVSISTNGGSTWTSSNTVTIGTGLLNTANKDFWFTGVCGQFFDFKIEFPSTNKTFQLVGIQVEFEPWGDVVSA